MVHPAFEHLTMPEDVWVTMSERGRKDFIENFLTYDIVQTIQNEDEDLDKTVAYRNNESQDNESKTDDSNPLMILAATASKIATTKKVSASNTITKSSTITKSNTIMAMNEIETASEIVTSKHNNSETRIEPAGKRKYSSR